VRREGGQCEAGLGEEVSVPDLDRPAREISRTGGAKRRRRDEKGEEKGEVFHGGRWRSRLSIRPS
jgi:hypothetical protein